METSINVPISAEQPCRLVARFFYRHAHSTKLQSTPKTPAFLCSFRHVTLRCLNARLFLCSSLQEDMLQNNAGGRMIKVKFLLRRKCEFGQQFCVIGDNQRLGGWAPEAALPMQWSKGHVWTVELDLLNGTCVEFKVLLKADQEVLQWQPGPNHKLEVSDRITPLLVRIPWSHDEENLENDSPGSAEMNDLQRTEDTVEITTSTQHLSEVIDDVRGMDLAIDPNLSLDVTDETKADERSDNYGTLKFRAKDFVDERQAGTNGILTADCGPTDDGVRPTPNLSPEEFFSSFAIPEAWYVEESRDVLVSGDFTEPSPALLEANALGRNLDSETAFYVNKEKEMGDKLLLSNEKHEMITEVTKVEADAQQILKEEYDGQSTGEDEQQPDEIATSCVRTMLDHSELEDIQEGNAYYKEANDIQRTSEDEPADLIAPANLQTMVSNGEPADIQQGNPHSKNEDGAQRMGEDEPAYAIAPTNVDTMLSNADHKYFQKGNPQFKKNGEQRMGEDEPAEVIAASNFGTGVAKEPENIQKGNAQILVSQQGPSEVTTKSKKNLIVETITVENGKPTAEEPATSPQNEENEIPSMRSDAVQTEGKKPAKEKKGGHKGWSKLWSAFVRGRIE